jgi:hypothetical protein
MAAHSPALLQHLEKSDVAAVVCTAVRRHADSMTMVKAGLRAMLAIGGACCLDECRAV